MDNPQPVSVRRPHTIPIILLVVLDIAAVVYTLFLYWQNTKLKSQIQNISKTNYPQMVVGNTIKTVPTLVTPASKPVDTSDWRVIEVDHWRFQVPPDWHYIRCKPGLLFVGPDIEKDQNVACGDGPATKYFYISRQSRKQLPDIPYTDSPDAVQKPIKVGTLQAIDLKLYFKGEPIEGAIYVKHEASIDEIRRFPQLDEPTFNQILATFQFEE